MKLQKIKVIDTNTTRNGWKYPLSVIKSMRKAIEATPINARFGEYNFPEKHTLDLENVAFTYENPVLENGNLYVDIQILETPKGKQLEEMIDNVSFVPVGMGVLDENNVMEDSYEFVSIAAINNI